MSVSLRSIWQKIHRIKPICVQAVTQARLFSSKHAYLQENIYVLKTGRNQRQISAITAGVLCSLVIIQIIRIRQEGINLLEEVGPKGSFVFGFTLGAASIYAQFRG
uniref:Uncharacterized protein n=1 Tax=Panagrolaimus sp. ES5 TaxID=591445 RepID=A0AC34FWT1_9BILA